MDFNTKKIAQTKKIACANILTNILKVSNIINSWYSSFSSTLDCKFLQSCQCHYKYICHLKLLFVTDVKFQTNNFVKYKINTFWKAQLVPLGFNDFDDFCG